MFEKGEIVDFDLLDPIPHEATEPMSFEELQRRLKERFGDAKKGN